MISTPLKTSDISVIIPTLNEQGNIEKLAAILDGCVGERIIVDGGSSDDTVVKSEAAGFFVVRAEPGRGTQLNHGVHASSGKVLLFLHADTLLPPDFNLDIIELLNHQPECVGAFTFGVNAPGFLLKLIVFLANFRSTRLRLPYGDQCYFMTREHYLHVGGFPEIPVMEDYAFIKKARQRGEIITLKSQVVTSARRWQQVGIIRTTVINQLMIVGYSIGISPEKLARLYRKSKNRSFKKTLRGIF